MALALGSGAPFTYEDLQNMPDDGHRRELVDGVLLVTPAPVPLHQRCVLILAAALLAAAPEDLEVLTAPLDWMVSDSTVFQPDVLVTRRNDVGATRLERTPLLVVEVLSPSTRLTDLGTKRLAYEAACVPSYWLVDPHQPSLTVLHLDAGRYVDAARVVARDPYRATRPFEVTVVPALLVA